MGPTNWRPSSIITVLTDTHGVRTLGTVGVRTLCAIRRRRLRKGDNAMASFKASRINLRTTPEQSKLIRRAAEAQRKSVSEFVLESACRSAESALFDTKTFMFDQQGWKQFSNALKRKAKAIPELVELFRESAPWD